MTRLKLDLAVVVSAEAFFTLTDLCGLAPDDAIASAVRTATTLTRAAFDLYPERARLSAPRLRQLDRRDARRREPEDLRRRTPAPPPGQAMIVSALRKPCDSPSNAM